MSGEALAEEPGAESTEPGAESGGTGAKAPRSMGELFFRAVERFADDEGDNIALRRREPTEWVDIDWPKYSRYVQEIGAGLIDLGIEKGDRVAVIANSRVEWAVMDIADFCIGAVTVPIYHSNLPGDVRYVLDNADARVVFCEDREQLAKVLEVKGELPKLEHAILIEGKVKESGFVLAYDKVREQGRALLAEDQDLVRNLAAQIEPQDIATFVYTSGTTGPPKGARLTHRNLLFEIDSVSQVLPGDERDETLLFLPMAHIFARLGYLLSLQMGFTVSFAENIDRLMHNLQEIRPTFVFSVPRIYEKVYSAVLSGVQSGSRLKKQIFAFAMAVGRAVSRLRQQGKWVPPYLTIPFQMAELLVFNKLKRTFGGELKYFVSGGAPLSKEIAEFFHASGILVLEGYGLTENTAAVCLNRLDKYRFGTVGPILPGCEVQIADDGEVLLRGDNVFSGYYKREEATREAIVDGWFHSGDIGEFDADGFLRITDRKKDIIVTSGGKNIAPQNIENMMKTAPLISQIMVYGDKRNFLTAVVTLDPADTKSYAERREIEWEEVEELYRHPKIFAKVEREIMARNKTLASYETIKKFAILEADFEVGEELTPTLKVKRKVTIEKYWDILDAFYDDPTKGGPA